MHGDLDCCCSAVLKYGDEVKCLHFYSGSKFEQTMELAGGKVTARIALALDDLR